MVEGGNGLFFLIVIINPFLVSPSVTFSFRVSSFGRILYADGNIEKLFHNEMKERDQRSVDAGCW